MKRNHIMLILMLLFFVLQGMAQDRILGGPAYERIEAVRIAFFTREMRLNPEEAKVFWPLYERYQESLETQKHDRRQSMEALGDGIEQMTDKELDELIDGRVSQAEEAFKARKEFTTQLRKVLPPIKVVAFFRAEEKFNQELMERLRDRQELLRPNLRR